MHDIFYEFDERKQQALEHLGVPKDCFRRNVPCPLCGGTDRYSWLPKRNKPAFCRKCGSHTWVSFAQQYLNLPYHEIAAELKKLQGPIMSAPATKIDNSASARNRRRIGSILSESLPIAGTVVEDYLKSRGLDTSKCGEDIMYHPAQVYWTQGENGPKNNGEFPALIGKVVDPAMEVAGVQIKYLAVTKEGGYRKTQKTLAMDEGAYKGGGIWLRQEGNLTLAVSEGIETAMAFMQIVEKPFKKKWDFVSAIDAGNLERFEPPPTYENIVIVGDSDSSYTGQSAMFGLAKRLKAEGKHVTVRCPSLHEDRTMLDKDYCDLL